MPDSLYLVCPFETRIGMTEAERAEPQLLEVTLDLTIDAAKVAKADDPAAGVDYALISEDMRVLAQTERKTIERLAEDITALMLQKYPVSSVKVSVWKIPELHGISKVCVSIERR